MGRLDEVDLSLSLNAREEERELTRAWHRLAQLRLVLGGLLYLVSQRWGYIEGIVKFSGALQAAIAAGGFGLIGLALLYAGLPRRAAPRLNAP